jgi:RNA polymerase sigma-70 factor (ECF subfamily)
MPRLLGWTVTVMRNLFIDRCRQRQVARRSKYNLHLLACPVGADTWDHPTSETRPTSKALADEEVAVAVATLDVKFRLVFELYASGLSLIQISSALGIPKATVGTRLYRARRKLRATLQATDAAIQGAPAACRPTPHGN